jgi:hypothetical protein
MALTEKITESSQMGPDRNTSISPGPARDGSKTLPVTPGPDHVPGILEMRFIAGAFWQSSMGVFRIAEGRTLITNSSVTTSSVFKSVTVRIIVVVESGQKRCGPGVARSPLLQEYIAGLQVFDVARNSIQSPLQIWL